MKKNIKSFMQSLRENKDGLLSGGFGSIKGGFSGITALLSTNVSDCTGTNSDDCENGSCGGTNNGGCDNALDCSKTTNNGGWSCTNYVSC